MPSEREELEKRTETRVQDASVPDLPPELCQYPDNGCEVSVTCLGCPFSKCLDDEPVGRKKALKLRRDAEIVRLYDGGKPARDIAGMFRISRRTVQKVIKSAGKNLEPE